MLGDYTGHRSSGQARKGRKTWPSRQRTLAADQAGFHVFPAPSRGGAEIGNLTLVQQIRAVQAEQAALTDPRLALEASREQECALADLDRGIITWVPDPALNLPS